VFVGAYSLFMFRVFRGGKGVYMVFRGVSRVVIGTNSAFRGGYRVFRSQYRVLKGPMRHTMESSL